MGSTDADKDARDDEKPQHEVRITRPFYLGVHEVTQGQYQAVMGQNPSHFKGSDDLPVERVSWLDAVRFCNKLSEREGRKSCYRIEGYAVTIAGGDGYRLPTEAEWEYACRAGTTTRFSFGDDENALGQYAWYSANASRQTHPVGEKPPNGFGLYDMHGNVWEWCWDGYDPGYYKRSPAVDPPGPGAAPARVLRGGGWIDVPRHARSAYRFRNVPGNRNDDLGFRLALVQSGR
jgi:formylglycine-generating enzyme required for sulfatase activity